MQAQRKGILRACRIAQFAAFRRAHLGNLLDRRLSLRYLRQDQGRRVDLKSPESIRSRPVFFLLSREQSLQESCVCSRGAGFRDPHIASESLARSRRPNCGLRHSNDQFLRITKLQRAQARVVTRPSIQSFQKEFLSIPQLGRRCACEHKSTSRRGIPQVCGGENEYARNSPHQRWAASVMLGTR